MKSIQKGLEINHWPSRKGFTAKKTNFDILKFILGSEALDKKKWKKEMRYLLSLKMISFVLIFEFKYIEIGLLRLNSIKTYD